MTRSPLSRTATRAMSRAATIKLLTSNACLGLGIVLLAAFLVVEFNGTAVNPLVPAIAALAVGFAAVLDRLTSEPV
ncbi:MAG: hypothetical protein WDZ49_12015 [Litorilinea sp.]